MNRNQLYSRVITALICNKIIIHPMQPITEGFLRYGIADNNCSLDIFIYRDRYSLYTLDDKHIIIHKYVK